LFLEQTPSTRAFEEGNSLFGDKCLDRYDRTSCEVNAELVHKFNKELEQDAFNQECISGDVCETNASWRQSPRNLIDTDGTVAVHHLLLHRDSDEVGTLILPPEGGRDVAQTSESQSLRPNTNISTMSFDSGVFSKFADTLTSTMTLDWPDATSSGVVADLRSPMKISDLLLLKFASFQFSASPCKTFSKLSEKNELRLSEDRNLESGCYVSGNLENLVREPIWQESAVGANGLSSNEPNVSPSCTLFFQEKLLNEILESNVGDPDNRLSYTSDSKEGWYTRNIVSDETDCETLDGRVNIHGTLTSTSSSGSVGTMVSFDELNRTVISRNAEDVCPFSSSSVTLADDGCSSPADNNRDPQTNTVENSLTNVTESGCSLRSSLLGCVELTTDNNDDYHDDGGKVGEGSHSADEIKEANLSTCGEEHHGIAAWNDPERSHSVNEQVSPVERFLSRNATEQMLNEGEVVMTSHDGSNWNSVVVTPLSPPTSVPSSRVTDSIYSREDRPSSAERSITSNDLCNSPDQRSSIESKILPGVRPAVEDDSIYQQNTNATAAFESERNVSLDDGLVTEFMNPGSIEIINPPGRAVVSQYDTAVMDNRADEACASVFRVHNDNNVHFDAAGFCRTNDDIIHYENHNRSDSNHDESEDSILSADRSNLISECTPPPPQPPASLRVRIRRDSYTLDHSSFLLPGSLNATGISSVQAELNLPGTNREDRHPSRHAHPPILPVIPPASVHNVDPLVRHSDDVELILRSDDQLVNEGGEGCSVKEGPEECFALTSSIEDLKLRPVKKRLQFLETKTAGPTIETRPNTSFDVNVKNTRLVNIESRRGNVGRFTPPEVSVPHTVDRSGVILSSPSLRLMTDPTSSHEINLKQGSSSSNKVWKSGLSNSMAAVRARVESERAGKLEHLERFLLQASGLTGVESPDLSVDRTAGDVIVDERLERGQYSSPYGIECPREALYSGSHHRERRAVANSGGNIDSASQKVNIFHPVTDSTEEEELLRWHVEQFELKRRELVEQHQRRLSELLAEQELQQLVLQQELLSISQTKSSGTSNQSGSVERVRSAPPIGSDATNEESVGQKRGLKSVVNRSGASRANIIDINSNNFSPQLTPPPHHPTTVEVHMPRVSFLTAVDVDFVQRSPSGVYYRMGTISPRGSVATEKSEDFNAAYKSPAVLRRRRTVATAGSRSPFDGTASTASPASAVAGDGERQRRVDCKLNVTDKVGACENNYLL